MKWKRMCINLIKWGFQTVLFSLLPLIFYMLLHWMFKLEEDPTRQYISELCTFTLVISSSIAIELAKTKYKNSEIKEIIFPAYLALLIIFFIIYGAIYFSFTMKLNLEVEIINNLFLFTKVISGIHFAIAILLQIVGGFYVD